MTKQSNQLITHIIEGIENVKGEEIQILDLRSLENNVTEYFIICTGNSNTQVDAIVNSIQKHVSKNIKDKPWHVEGDTNSQWILMDYINVVVHVFQRQSREFYDIEGLWGDAKITHIETNY